MATITEGKASIYLKKTDKISKEMPIFYNPVMKLNRDMSILVLNSLNKTDMRLALPLAASGIRGLRFLLELPPSKVKELHLNDYDTDFINNIKKNMKLNKIHSRKVFLHNTDANLFLLNEKGFDYIDIDPFGTPNPFLDSAVKRISRNGILAITATDTSALCGTYPLACKRKYWAAPLRNELMHEIGLRILIRKVQLIGSQFERALIPLFSYSKDHYMRVFFQCEKGKKNVDKVSEYHKYFQGAGPLWAGKLWDEDLVAKMVKINLVKENEKFLNILKDESKISTIGFYDIHKIAKRNKLQNIPRKLDLIHLIQKVGYKASETHFNPEAIRSDIPLAELEKYFT
ncbi:MAG TPA: tRNA (guanine(26)-N(2))-dimethyltransferase [Candidatus Nanoarchaeia archaeon]|nr:tRNA (guanine(26)-N(2))-dimethyltransferase [Candidatus Nanoarchaeia archaeon]